MKDTWYTKNILGKTNPMIKIIRAKPTCFTKHSNNKRVYKNSVEILHK